MKDHIDMRTIGYGSAGFVAAQFLAALVVGSTAKSSDGTAFGNAMWLLINLSSYVVPMLAGFLAASCATHRKVVHGALAVFLGALFFSLLSASPTSLAAAAIHSLLGWLGAIAGSFVGRRNGA